MYYQAFVQPSGARGKAHAVLMRFDCGLSLDVNDPEMQGRWCVYKSEFYYEHGWTKQQRQRIEEQNRKLRRRPSVSARLQPGAFDATLPVRPTDEQNRVFRPAPARPPADRSLVFAGKQRADLRQAPAHRTA